MRGNNQQSFFIMLTHKVIMVDMHPIDNFVLR